MNCPGVVVRFVRRWPKEDLVRLYKVGGWWDSPADVSHVRRLISGSFVFAVAVDAGTGRAIGMGRVLSDGVSDAYIQDVVVLPEYRRRKVGVMLVAALRDYCLRKKIGWIGLVAASGTVGFYRKAGFRVVRGHKAMRHVG